jgi:hypothetical protein
VNIVEKYDRQSLYPMLLECYHYLHQKAKSKVGCVYQIRHANSDLNIFEQTPNTSEPTIELVIKEMLIFRCYQMDSKDIKHLFQWRVKHETIFPNVGFLDLQILEIIGSQIEIERIFFFSTDIYKFEKILFTIKKYRETNIVFLEIAGLVVPAHGSRLMRLRIGEEPFIRLLTSIGIERV